MKKTQNILDILSYIDSKNLSKLELERLESEIDSMTGATIPKRNKWRDDTAKEIKEEMNNIFDEYYSEEGVADDFMHDTITYIDKEILCLGDNK